MKRYRRISHQPTEQWARKISEFIWSKHTFVHMNNKIDFAGRFRDMHISFRNDEFDYYFLWPVLIAFCVESQSSR